MQIDDTHNDPNLALSRFMTLKVHVALESEAAMSACGPERVWLAKRAVERLLAPLPPSALEQLTNMPNGHILVGGFRTRYHPSLYAWQEDLLRSVVLVDVSELESCPERFLRALARLVDHLLGSGLAEPVAFISEGATVFPSWQEFHSRLVDAFTLGYASDQQAQLSPSTYFTWSFSQYCLDRKQLSSVDPLAYRLLHSTVFSEAFWRAHPLERASDSQ